VRACRKAQTLRERGIALSEVMREAIDERFTELRQRESQPDVRTIVRRIFEQYPDPLDLPPVTITSTTDVQRVSRFSATKGCPILIDTTPLWPCATRATRNMRRL
jgi:hypothetical protein